MITCRYVGGESSEIGNLEFDEVGQVATFTEQGFVDALLGRAKFISAADFGKIFTDENELREFGPSGMRVDPPVSFSDRLHRAQQLCNEVARNLQAANDLDRIAIARSYSLNGVEYLAQV